MSAGIRSDGFATFLTDRIVYRTGIVGVDAGGPDAAAIPIIRLDADLEAPNQVAGSPHPVYPPNPHGHNAYLAVWVTFVQGTGTATLQLWQWGGPEPFPWAAAGMVGQWCKVRDPIAVTDNTLLTFLDLPAAPAKLTVTAKAGGAATLVIQQSV